MHSDIFIGCRPKEPTPREVRTLAERITRGARLDLGGSRPLRAGESPEFPPMGGESFPPLPRVRPSPENRCPCCGRPK